MKRGIISLLLAVLFLASFAMPGTASATTAAPAPHSHSNAHVCEECAKHQQAESVQWEALTQEIADSKPFEASHHYYLTGDITLSKVKEDYEIPVGTDITICLNGYTILFDMAVSEGQTQAKGFIRARGTFTLTDCTAHYENGTYVAGVLKGMGNAVEQGVETPKCMRVVYVYNTMNIYDGIMTDFYYDWGGVVNIRCGVVNMYGGEIYGNETTSGGGAVHMAQESDTTATSTFNMYGGVIRNNKSVMGGGINMHVDGVVFNMLGGEIRENEATDAGGGVYVRKAGTVNMTGGKIVNNSAAVFGGIAGTSKAVLNKSGGEISGNTGGDVDTKITLHDGTVTEPTVPDEPPVPSKPEPVIPDGPYLPSGQVHTHSDSHQCEACKETVVWEACDSAAGLPTSGTHHVYLTADITLAEQWLIASGADITVCLNGYNIGAKATHTRIDGKGTTLTITDCTAAEVNGQYVAGAYFRDTTEKRRAFYFSDSSDGVVMNLYGGIITGFEIENTGGVVNYGKNGTFNMYGGLITRNKTPGKNGGAIYVKGTGTFNMYGGTISENSAVKGAGVYGNYNTHLNINGGTITGNVSTEDGGGVYAYGNLDILGGTISNNYAGGKGGGVATTEWYVDGEWLTAKNAVISGNYAETAGGGIWVGDGVQNRIIMDNLTITDNSTGGNGGGMSLTGTTVMSNLTITGNSAKLGGGVYFDTEKNDGHSLVVGYYTVAGNMIVRDNTGSDLYLPDKTGIAVSKDGLGKNTYMGITLASGVLTDALQGKYNYEGGALKYVVTYGDRSVTDPEYDPASELQWKAPVNNGSGGNGGSSQTDGNTDNSQTGDTGGDLLAYMILCGVAVVALSVMALTYQKRPRK